MPSFISLDGFLSVPSGASLGIPQADVDSAFSFNSDGTISVDPFAGLVSARPASNPRPEGRKENTITSEQPATTFPDDAVSEDLAPLPRRPVPPDFEPEPPVVNERELTPLPRVPVPPEFETEPAPVVDRAIDARAAEEAQIAADAAGDRRRRLALIRERQNPTGPRGLLTRPLVQRPRLLGH